MNIAGLQTRNRKFQRQIIPYYIGEKFDFSYDLSLFSPSNNVEFGLKSSDGTIISKYSLKSGFVYDYSGRIISTYRAGENKLTFGIKRDPFTSGFFSYQVFNDRPISFNDAFADYQSKPVEEFYIKNNTTTPFDFDLNIKGFVPPTLFSELVPIAANVYSGHMIQSGYNSYPFDRITYGIFGIEIAESQGKITSIGGSGSESGSKTGSGKISYLVSGSSITNGNLVTLTFDTYFGKVQTGILVNGSFGSQVINGNPETGTSISIYGPSNLLPAGGDLTFQIDYMSNKTNNLYIELDTDSAYALQKISGEAEGTLAYSGIISKNGLLYSEPFLRGTADLQSVANSVYNTNFSLADRYAVVSQRVSTRSLSTVYTGVNELTKKKLLMTGQYHGSFAPLNNYYFECYGDAIFNHNFIGSENGVVSINENQSCFPVFDYTTGIFYVASTLAGLSNPSGSGTRIRYSGNSFLAFPDDVGTARVSGLFTGQGVMTTTVPYGTFFGYGSAAVNSSRVELNGSGPGEVLYYGNALDWIGPDGYAPYAPVISNPGDAGRGAVCILDPVRGYGELSNGVQSFYGSGLPSPPLQTWGYPTGPSRIVVEPQTLAYRKFFSIPYITGYYVGSEGTARVTGFGFTGYAFAYVDFPGGTYPGPVFPEPGDTEMYPYEGNNESIKVNGTSYFGRGIIYNSGVLDDGNSLFGMYITDDDNLVNDSNLQADGNFKYNAVFDITSGQYHANHNITVSQAYITLSTLYPARRDLNVNGGPGVAGEQAYIEFENPEIYKTESHTIHGAGFAQNYAISSRYDLFYSQNPDSFPVAGYKANGWYNATKFFRTPYYYPSQFKQSYLKVKSLSTDPETFENLTLRAYTAGKTGEITITTNTNV